MIGRNGYISLTFATFRGKVEPSPIINQSTVACIYVPRNNFYPCFVTSSNNQHDDGNCEAWFEITNNVHVSYIVDVGIWSEIKHSQLLP